MASHAFQSGICFRYLALACLIAAVRDWLGAAGLDASLRDLGVVPGDLPGLSREAEQQWTAQFNPRPICAADFEVLYGQAFD